MNELENYENPTTTKENIKELQELLVQTVIDFINDKQLFDIDEVNININGLEDSVKWHKWMPSTDSYIDVIGLQTKGKIRVRKLIGNYC